MNWYKAKTILIIFFLIMNIFLLSNIIYSANKSSVVTPEIIQSTVEVLKNNDININYDQIPSKISYLQSVEVINIINDDDSFANQILGTYIKDGEKNLYINDNQNLLIEGDYFKLTSNLPIYFSDINNVTESNASDKAISILRKYGFILDKVYTEVEILNGVYSVKIIKLINSKPVYGSEINVTFSNDGLIGFDGCWFNDSDENSIFNKKIELKSAPSVLVDFILNSNRPQTTSVITDITLGYYTGENSVYHKSIALIPVWAITLDNNDVFYLDARKNE